jgi:hypothetical protein
VRLSASDTVEEATVGVPDLRRVAWGDMAYGALGPAGELWISADGLVWSLSGEAFVTLEDLAFGP